MSRVTITINTRDRHEYLAVTLASLLGQTNQEWDLILLDGSQNPSINQEYIARLLHLFKRYGHDVQYITDPASGISQTYQIGMETAKTELVMRMEDDVWFEPEALEYLVEAILTDSHIACVGLMTPHWKVGMRVPPPSDGIFKNGFVRETHSPDAPELAEILNPVDQQSCLMNSRKLYDVCTLHGGCLYRKTALQSIGGWATDFTPTGHREETMVYCQLWFAGWRLVVCPRSRLWHFESTMGGSRPSGVKAKQRLDDRHLDELKFQARLLGLIAAGHPQGKELLILDKKDLI